MAYGPLGAGAGAAEGLQDVLTQMYRDRALRQEAERFRVETERQRALEAENARRWTLQHERQVAADAVLKTMRDAEAEKDRAEADARAARTKGIGELISDPSRLSTMTPVQRLLSLSQLGVANIGVHDLETSDEHRAHTSAEKDAAFADWQRRADYTERQRRSRPVRESAGVIRAFRDDPSYPRGVQSYVVQLRSKHPTFEAAMREASSALPQLQSAHPNLSPQKFLNGLRQAFTGAGQSDDSLDDLVVSAMREDGPEPSTVPAGRGVNPSAAAVPNGNGQTEAQLAQRAAQVLQGLGKDASPASVQKFLSNAQNRRRLMAGGQ